MPRLRMFQGWMAALLLGAGLCSIPALAATKTFTGKVSDSMCGAKHHEGMSPADCVRACVEHGGKYALVSGDKVYTLDTSDKAQMEELSKLAWENAKVKGTLSGDTISVKSVSAAK